MNQVVGNLTEPVFRPPSEWDALLLAVTNGCTHRCTFCSMYRTKKFSIRKDVAEIKRDIDQARLFYGARVRKLFLEDGNAFTVKPELLTEVTEYAYSALPNLKKVSAYAHARDIVKKTDEELAAIARAGFSMVYIGIESGDDEVLKAVRKGTNQEEYVEAAHKCHRAGIAWSAIFLLGLAGNDPEKSRQHALESAKLINRMAPPPPTRWYVSPLTLEIAPGSDMWQMEQDGEFASASFTRILEELYTLIEETDDHLRNCIFNTNHVSNYLVLKGELAKDKASFLRTIDAALKDPVVRQYDW